MASPVSSSSNLPSGSFDSPPRITQPASVKRIKTLASRSLAFSSIAASSSSSQVSSFSLSVTPPRKPHSTSLTFDSDDEMPEAPPLTPPVSDHSTVRGGVVSTGRVVLPLPTRITPSLSILSSNQSQSSSASSMPAFRLVAPAGFDTVASSSMTKKAPPDVKKENPVLREKYGKTTLVKEVVRVRDAARLKDSFDLEVSPGQKKHLTDIEFLSAEGQFSKVYSCRADGKKYVLKVFKDEIWYSKIHLCVAKQLWRYLQNKNHPFLKDHIARFENFEPHLEKIKGKTLEEVKEYVQKEATLGFSLVEYVPNPFPEPATFDEKNSVWKSAKEILEVSYKENICNDTSRFNIRIKEDGTVVLIDLFELNDEELCYERLLDTFSDVKEIRNILDPRPEEVRAEFLLAQTEASENSGQNSFCDLSP